MLKINKRLKLCSFMGQDDTHLFGLRTDNIGMTADDYIEVTSTSGGPSTTIKGPLKSCYLLLGHEKPRINFNFAKPSNSIEFVKFIQNNFNVPIVADTKSEIQIMSKLLKLVSINLVRTIKQPVHVQVLGSTETSGHYLMSDDSLNLNLSCSTDICAITVKTSPALAECSQQVSSNEEKSYQLTGPSKQPGGSYTCATVFKNLIATNEAHFDVDFSNFLRLSNLEDELTLDDGLNNLKLASLGAGDYMRKIISFGGKELAVIYDSPGPISPTNIPFKLTVKSKASGGLLQTDRTIDLSKVANALYTLQPQDGRTVTLELENISNAQLTISDDSSRQIVFDQKAILPPVITSGQANKKMYLNISSKPNSKPSGIIRFRSNSAECGGTLFDTAGSFSAAGPKTCNWLIGAPKTMLDVTYNNLGPNGCLEIYDTLQANPLFKSCNLTQSQALPRFYLRQSYIKISTNASESSFQASVSPRVNTVIDLQRNISSIGYPIIYPWSSESDTVTINGVNKTMVLSVADLDIRAGEKLMIGGSQVQASQSDYDISNKSTKIDLIRSTATKDFLAHRGFQVIAREYQKILIADPAKDSLVTPKNLTSLLIRVPAKKGYRVLYNISSSSADTFKVTLIDSRTILGRRVDDDSKINGSTTSDTLLVSISAIKKNSFIPTISLNYKQIACNTTNHDHVCDDSSRCVPADKLCKGKSYCMDKSDLGVPCSSGPSPAPTVIERGVGGFAAFVLCMLMFTLGVVGALYGPDLFRSLESRFRSGHYTTFTSTE